MALVISINDPANPVIKGHTVIAQANGVYVSGNYAYVAGGDGGLNVVDITDHDNPVFKSSIVTHGYANDVYVSGNYAYVADGDGGLGC
jgi:hypothetical protein